jgi:hypothetical protein
MTKDLWTASSPLPTLWKPLSLKTQPVLLCNGDVCASRYLWSGNWICTLLRPIRRKLEKVKKLLLAFCPNRLWCKSNSDRGFFPGERGLRVELTRHLHAVPIWWNSGRRYLRFVRLWKSKQLFGRITTSHLTYTSRIKSSFFGLCPSSN